MKKKTSGKRKTATVAPVPAEAKKGSEKPRMAIAVVALIINALLLPGLGTLIGGKTKDGLIQLLALTLGGFCLGVLSMVMAVSTANFVFLLLAMLGGLIMLAGWIWAIVSGITLVKNAGT